MLWLPLVPEQDKVKLAPGKGGNSQPLRSQERQPGATRGHILKRWRKLSWSLACQAGPRSQIAHPRGQGGRQSISRKEAPHLSCFHMASRTTAPGSHPAPGTGTAQQFLVTGEVPGLLVSSLSAFCSVSIFNSSLVQTQEGRR